MIDLEWLRTFRAVYRTKSLSRASELLHISQPTVSQHLRALEQVVGRPLFERRSKGVADTDEGRRLNTLIAGALETLEEVETGLGHRQPDAQRTITIGISPHLYPTLLAPHLHALGGSVHVSFGSKDDLVTGVQEGRLLYAIVPDEVNTFDIVGHRLFRQELVIAATPDIEVEEAVRLYKGKRARAEQWLARHTWYAHDAAAGSIKLYWLHVFNRKRPAIQPAFVVPNEHELLAQQAQGSGLSVAFDSVVEPFVEAGTLTTHTLKRVPIRAVSLLASKTKAPKAITERLLEILV